MHSTNPALPSLWPAGPRAASDILQIAHRGGASGAEDYRLANLRRIARLGAHLVEVDLRTTSDGSLIAYHDPTVRVDGTEWRVNEHALAEWRERLPSGRMPLAETVLAAVRDAGLGLYLDVKDVPSTAAARLIRLLTNEQMTAKTILASTNPESVALFSRISGLVPRAVLFRERDADPLQVAGAAQANFVHPCWEDEERPDQLLHTWLHSVREHDLGVICWHEERPKVLTALRDLGVDGICTDAPGLLAEILSL
jgi:glycerophosphoryl diester phosphodiesterase